jgi:hypothetical protein
MTFRELVKVGSIIEPEGKVRARVDKGVRGLTKARAGAPGASSSGVLSVLNTDKHFS